MNMARMPDEDARAWLLQRYDEEQTIKQQEYMMRREQERHIEAECKLCDFRGANINEVVEHLEREHGTRE